MSIYEKYIWFFIWLVEDVLWSLVLYFSGKHYKKKHFSWPTFWSRKVPYLVAKTFSRPKYVGRELVAKASSQIVFCDQKSLWSLKVTIRDQLFWSRKVQFILAKSKLLATKDKLVAKSQRLDPKKIILLCSLGLELLTKESPCTQSILPLCQ